MIWQQQLRSEKSAGSHRHPVLKRLNSSAISIGLAWFRDNYRICGIFVAWQLCCNEHAFFCIYRMPVWWRTSINRLNSLIEKLALCGTRLIIYLVRSNIWPLPTYCSGQEIGGKNFPCKKFRAIFTHPCTRQIPLITSPLNLTQSISWHIIQFLKVECRYIWRFQIYGVTTFSQDNGVINWHLTATSINISTVLGWTHGTRVRNMVDFAFSTEYQTSFAWLKLQICRIYRWGIFKVHDPKSDIWQVKMAQPGYRSGFIIMRARGAMQFWFNNWLFCS
jgi:hypothetical protein